MRTESQHQWNYIEAGRCGSSGGKLRVAAWVGLSDKKCLEKIRGLNDCDRLGAGILFRRRPVQGLEKFRQVCPPAFLRSSAALSHLYALLITVPWCLRFRPHVCVGISLMPHSILAKLGQIACGATFVNWLIGSDIYVELPHKWWGRLLQRPMAGASSTLTMGSGSNKKLKAMGWSSDRLLVGRNDYDFSDYNDHKIEMEKEWDIVYTGRLDRAHKRIDVLLLAVNELRISHPGVRCAIVGEGPDRKRLEGIRRSLDIEAQVDFLRHQDDISGLLSKSRILVMTSAWEGLPSSIVEAFACGVPVVTADVGDISDVVVNSDNGILVNPAAPPADYAEAIGRLLDNPDEYHRMSRSAKRTGDRIRRQIEDGVPAARWEQALKKAICDH
ncbi:MAG: glycosyltransferase [Desulfatiglandaceae bacterium]